MKSCAAAKTVRRLVFTSSAGTVNIQEHQLPVYDESCWSDMEFCRAKKMTGWVCISTTSFWYTHMQMFRKWLLKKLSNNKTYVENHWNTLIQLKTSRFSKVSKSFSQLELNFKLYLYVLIHLKEFLEVKNTKPVKCFQGSFLEGNNLEEKHFLLLFRCTLSPRHWLSKLHGSMPRKITLTSSVSYQLLWLALS